MGSGLSGPTRWVYGVEGTWCSLQALYYTCNLRAAHAEHVFPVACLLLRFTAAIRTRACPDLTSPPPCVHGMFLVLQVCQRHMPYFGPLGCTLSLQSVHGSYWIQVRV